MSEQTADWHGEELRWLEYHTWVNENLLSPYRQREERRFTP